MSVPSVQAVRQVTTRGCKSETHGSVGAAACGTRKRRPASMPESAKPTRQPESRPRISGKIDRWMGGGRVNGQIDRPRHAVSDLHRQISPWDVERWAPLVRILLRMPLINEKPGAHVKGPPQNLHQVLYDFEQGHDLDTVAIY
jgi:hypothetical protein